MVDSAVPLLNREDEEGGKIRYHEKCPGCDVEKFKHSSNGIPLKHFFFIWIVTLCAGENLLSQLQSHTHTAQKI